MSRRNSKQKPTESAKFYDHDDLDDAFDAEHSIHNPFSSGQVSASSSKWSIKDSWRKLEQMIENRDKANQNSKHKENHSQELNDLLDYSIHEGEEIQEGDTGYVPADSSYSDLSEDKDASASGGEINVSVPLNTESARDGKTNNDRDRGNKDNRDGNKAGDSSSTGSEKDGASTLSNSIKDNKKDDITPAIATATSRTHHAAMHKIQFSKIKKNCSIERINDEPDEKDAEKELLDAKRATRDESIKASNSDDKLSSSALINSNHQTATAPHSIHHKPAPQIRFSVTPTKQTPLGSRSASFSSSSALKRRINERMNLSECEEESSIDGFSTTGSSEKTFKRSTVGKPQASSTPNGSVDDPIPSLPYFMSFVVDRVRERFNFISFTSSFCTFFILILAIQFSPLSSFANGFLIGIIFCTMLLIIFIIYALNYIFVKIDYENDLHERIMSNQRWKKVG